MERVKKAEAARGPAATTSLLLLRLADELTQMIRELYRKVTLELLIFFQFHRF